MLNIVIILINIKSIYFLYFLRDMFKNRIFIFLYLKQMYIFVSNKRQWCNYIICNTYIHSNITIMSFLIKSISDIGIY